MKSLKNLLSKKGFKFTRINFLTDIKNILRSGLLLVVPVIIQFLNGKISFNIWIISLISGYSTVFLVNIYIYLKRKNIQIFSRQGRYIIKFGILKNDIAFFNLKEMPIVILNQNIIFRFFKVVDVIFPISLSSKNSIKVAIRVKNLPHSLKIYYQKQKRYKNKTYNFQLIAQKLLYAIINCDYLSTIILIYPFIKDIILILGDEFYNKLIIPDNIKQNLKNVGIPYIISGVLWFFLLTFIISVIIEYPQNGSTKEEILKGKKVIFVNAPKKSINIINEKDVICRFSRRFLLLYPFNIESNGIGIRNENHFIYKNRLNKNLSTNTIFIITKLFEKCNKKIYAMQFKPRKNGFFSYIMYNFWSLIVIISVGFILTNSDKISIFSKEIILAIWIMLIIFFSIRILLNIVDYFNTHIGINDDEITICKKEGLSIYKITLKKCDITKIVVSQNLLQKRRNLCNISFFIVGSKKSIAKLKQFSVSITTQL